MSVSRVRNFFSSTKAVSLVISLLRAGMSCLVTCYENLKIFFYAPSSAFDMAFSKLAIFWNNVVCIDFKFLDESLSIPCTICTFKIYSIWFNWLIDDIFSLILGNLLSIAFKLFICFTKSDTFVVDIFNSLIEAYKYFSN